MNFRNARLSLAAVVLFGLLSTQASRAASENSPAGTAPRKISVLFIGNSLTHQNNLPAMLKFIASGARPPVDIEVDMVSVGGAKLEKHWSKGDALKKIEKGGWDFVVIQEYSTGPLKEKDAMLQHARLFDAQIRKAGARTLLYLTWALQKSPEDQEAITQTYMDLGKELGAGVVPVGLARVNAAKANPDIALFVKDGKHPTPGGTYLAACTFYTMLTGLSPKDLPCKIPDPRKAEKTLVSLTPEVAAFFQRVAEETVRAHQVQPLQK